MEGASALMYSSQRVYACERAYVGGVMCSDARTNLVERAYASGMIYAKEGHMLVGSIDMGEYMQM